MRTVKTISVILVLSLLVLSLAGASPNAWGWLTQGSSSATSEVQLEPSTAQSGTQKKVSTSSENTSADVVVMSKSDLAAAIALIEAGEEDAKKSKMTVEEVEKMALASNAATTAYNRLMRTRFLIKGLCGWNLQSGLDFGLGLAQKSPNFRSGFFCLKKFLPGKHVEKPEGMELIPIKRRFIKNFLRKYNIPKSE